MELDLEKRIFSALPRHHWLTEFVLHVLTGLMAVAAHYGLMFVMLHFSAGAVVASSVGFMAGATTRFLLSYFHVFMPTLAVPHAMARFVLVLAAQFFANALILALVLTQLSHVWLAQVITTVALTGFNFLAYRIWVFR